MPGSSVVGLQITRSSSPGIEPGEQSRLSCATHATAHWWKNAGNTTAVLLSADLFHPKSDPHQM
ncbi:hypothetical protein [Methylobacterium nodulans]|uniref:hypothetical protein n=1 Tax=Methylobacterium nodulans TaxID=114616 RepID=UPI0018DEC5AC|nr:hypothetical protein [Methylobacterium nodulans]